MREFENERFNHKLAESLTSPHLETETQAQKDALSYISQFVYHISGRTELYHGYITEAQLDALVEIRDNNSNRHFSRAVEALGVEGETSTNRPNAEPLKVEIESRDVVENKLDDFYYDCDKAETRKIIRSIQDVYHNSRGSVEYYAPKEAVQQLLFSGIL
jgi:hypothetical protein